MQMDQHLALLYRSPPSISIPLLSKSSLNTEPSLSCQVDSHDIYYVETIHTLTSPPPIHTSFKPAEPGMPIKSTPRHLLPQGQAEQVESFSCKRSSLWLRENYICSKLKLINALLFPLKTNPCSHFRSQRRHPGLPAQ